MAQSPVGFVAGCYSASKSRPGRVYKTFGAEAMLTAISFPAMSPVLSHHIQTLQ